jgi:type I restriction-modification system DNA methylase subunit
MMATTAEQLALNLDPAYNNQYLFSDHYLYSLLTADPRWPDAMAETQTFLAWLKARYTAEQSQLPDYNESQLEDEWIRPILQQLSHVYQGQASLPGLGAGIKKPDYVFFPDEAARQTAVSAQRSQQYTDQALAIGEAKAWTVALGKKRKGGGPRFDDQNPSQQINYYLQSSGLEWGILTNGRFWRLIHRESSHRLTVYYEIDLLDLLERDDPGQMRYFTLFFRQAAFLADAQGRYFLKDALQASRRYALELEEDLQENVYEALQWLIQGFLDLPQNNLTAADLPAIYENSLYLLYRLLFILYAESRGLLPLHNRDYREHYSLADLKKEIAGDNVPLAPMTDINWNKLQTLFRIINGDNEPLNRHLGVPRYNGGLFDPRQHPFLQEKKVGDRALVRAIDLLCRRQTAQGQEFVDYRTLGVRQLGSIYEGLLEYRPAVAQEPLVAVRQGKGEQWQPATAAPATATISDRRQAGQVYLLTDKGERKATGSYYTPAYIVEYIVENTLGPLVEAATQRVRERGRQVAAADQKAVAQSLVDELLNLKVLDPAMGSGHFLVAATDYLAVALATDPYVQREPLMSARNRVSGRNPVSQTQTTDAEEDVTYWRRLVVERCIYGVDRNPLAVELAKLSLWLATVAADQPLSFLDHHLKCGDSLVGARVADLGWPPPAVLGKKGQRQLAQQQAGQMNLFEYRLSQQLPAVMGKVLEIVGQESDSYETVQAKEAADEAVRQLKAPFEAVANLWVSAYFSGETAYGPAAYDEARDALGNERLWQLPAVQTAQQIAAERRFFHWELAFPEVFYDAHGQPLGDQAGFDAIIGNPPYFSISTSSKHQSSFLKANYPDVYTGNSDISYYFLAKVSELPKQGGLLGMIVARYFQEAKYAKGLRAYLAENSTLQYVVDFQNYQVFGPDVNVLTSVVILRRSSESHQNEHVYVLRLRDDTVSEQAVSSALMSDTSQEFDSFSSPSPYDGEVWRFVEVETLQLVDKVHKNSVLLGTIARVVQGMQTGRNEVLAPSSRLSEKYRLTAQ